MKLLLPLIAASLLIPALLPAAPATPGIAARTPAPKPLYRDPIFDGAADPIVVWNPQVGRWWMFYTNRRANAPGLPGVTWVHGTKIGIAQSADRGTTWTYLRTADIDLPVSLASDHPTEWAPEIATSRDGVHHLFLAVVPGIFADWHHPRTIVHLTSTDLVHWRHAQALHLSSDRVIDPCVHALPDGTWRLWYNNEADHKSIYYADSPDLTHWTDRGRCEGLGHRPGEGPFVFTWKGRDWMLIDHWHGLGVYWSTDFTHWHAQHDDLLAKPGRGADDGVVGGHPGVVVSGGRAWLFYFTQPGRTHPPRPGEQDTVAWRRSSIQVVELHEAGGRLSCDRDAPTYVDLEPPADPDAPRE